MAYFPNKVMPKQLRRETSSEVDGSPLILNARDHNVHEREIISIESLLIGNGSNPSLSQIVAQLQAQANSLVNGNLISRHNGTVSIGSSVPIPPGVASTTTSGFLSSASTTITVASTAGFPSSGYLTKFNNTTAVVTQMTNQEVILYTGKTATTFTGCTRGANGSTAQNGTNAVLIPGYASLSLSTKSSNTTASVFSTLTAAHTESLVLKAVTGTGDGFSVNYSLVVVGGVQLIDVSQIFGLG